VVCVVVHTSPLPHQKEFAGYLERGFKRHGLSVEVTADIHAEGDIHVIQGPHYAYSTWIGKPRVLFLDRCFYGDSKKDVSLGWLRPDGSRDFMNHAMPEPNGRLPELKPEKTGDKTIVFADYGKRNRAVTAAITHDTEHIRLHPAEGRDHGPLEAVWRDFDVAVGGSSTVLVEAAINGLRVISYDPRHVCQNIADRRQWVTDLSWAQWHYDQIANGRFWEHLCIE